MVTSSALVELGYTGVCICLFIKRYIQDLCKPLQSKIYLKGKACPCRGAWALAVTTPQAFLTCDPD